MLSRTLEVDFLKKRLINTNNLFRIGVSEIEFSSLNLMVYKRHLFKMQTVNSRAEYRRIKKFLEQTLTGQIFKIIARSPSHIKFKILPHSEGQCLIIINVS